MKITKFQFRMLVMLAILTFIGTAFAEFGTAGGLPAALREWERAKPRSLDVDGLVGGLIAILSIVVGLVGYIGSFFIKKWGGICMLAHAVLFFVANYFLGPHVYTGITQMAFLVYTFLVGMIVVHALQIGKAN